MERANAFQKWATLLAAARKSVPSSNASKSSVSTVTRPDIALAIALSPVLTGLLVVTAGMSLSSCLLRSTDSVVPPITRLPTVPTPVLQKVLSASVAEKVSVPFSFCSSVTNHVSGSLCEGLSSGFSPKDLQELWVSNLIDLFFLSASNLPDLRTTSRRTATSLEMSLLSLAATATRVSRLYELISSSLLNSVSFQSATTAVTARRRKTGPRSSATIAAKWATPSDDATLLLPTAIMTATVAETAPSAVGTTPAAGIPVNTTTQDETPAGDGSWGADGGGNAW
ncbi:hypothetical protein BJX65DRAFT_234625 [Aspergillus insuetus]